MKLHEYQDGPFKGYRVDRRLFIIALSTIIAYLCFAGAIEYKATGTVTTGVYLHCPEDAKGLCHNTLREECYLGERIGRKACGDDCLNQDKLCTKEILYPGETIGHEPGRLFNNAVPFTLGVIVLSLLFNHLAYNRRWKPKS